MSAGLGLTDEEGTPNDDEIESFYKDSTVGETFAAIGTVEDCKAFADGVTVVDFFTYMSEEQTEVDEGSSDSLNTDLLDKNLLKYLGDR